MLNVDKVKDAYLACGATDLRKSIDGLALIMETHPKKDSYQNALFVFFNKSLKFLLGFSIYSFDAYLMLYYVI